MGKFPIILHFLALVVFGFLIPLASGKCNKTKNLTNENETRQSITENGLSYQNKTSGNTSVEICNARVVNYASSWILNALDNITNHLFCVIYNNEGFSGEKLLMLENDLTRIMESTLNIYNNLKNNDTESTAIIDLFGALNTNNHNQNNGEDMSIWFKIKIQPLLPFLTKEFLTLLSTKNFTCQSYQAIVNGFNEQFSTMNIETQQMIYRNFMLMYLSRKDISDPGCLSESNGMKDWIEKNFGLYFIFVTLEDLVNMEENISVVEVLPSLSTEQIVDLLLEALSNTLENETVVINVVSSLLTSLKGQELDEFFDNFAQVTEKRNLTVIENSAVRNIMLNLTLTALAPRLDTFAPNDFAIWFQHYLVVLMPSLQPSSLDVIPRNITCQSYRAIFTGLDQSIESLSQDLTHGIESCKVLLMQRAPYMCTPLSVAGHCEDTPINDRDVCSALQGSPSDQLVAHQSAAGMLCNFSIADFVCSPEAEFTKENLISLLQCKLATSLSYPLLTWKLIFTKFSAVLDEALDSYSDMVHRIPSRSNAFSIGYISTLQATRYSLITCKQE
ncbi:uncharacterized protein LOC125742357 [Brienomyrus brachyistius]|uniref:uncharacterized protein LOC125742357 n=1 Tax=Brienomyrus brachyistius TaxID=42636 RepID=UPI0020B2AD12|nr:uncharacterized protein LOC125742357 [Brienomyrus brachyistius]